MNEHEPVVELDGWTEIFGSYRPTIIHISLEAFARSELTFDLFTDQLHQYAPEAVVAIGHDVMRRFAFDDPTLAMDDDVGAVVALSASDKARLETISFFSTILKHSVVLEPGDDPTDIDSDADGPLGLIADPALRFDAILGRFKKVARQGVTFRSAIARTVRCAPQDFSAVLEGLTGIHAVGKQCGILAFQYQKAMHRPDDLVTVIERVRDTLAHAEMNASSLDVATSIPATTSAYLHLISARTASVFGPSIGHSEESVVRSLAADLRNAVHRDAALSFADKARISFALDEITRVLNRGAVDGPTVIAQAAVIAEGAVSQETRNVAGFAESDVGKSWTRLRQTLSTLADAEGAIRFTLAAGRTLLSALQIAAVSGQSALPTPVARKQLSAHASAVADATDVHLPLPDDSTTK